MENKMENCKFGLNDHKPFLKDKNEHHNEHHHHHNESCSHDHDHEHEHGHSHDHSGTDKNVLNWALSNTLVIMFLEFFFGFLSNSLALI